MALGNGEACVEGGNQCLSGSDADFNGACSDDDTAAAYSVSWIAILGTHQLGGVWGPLLI